MKKGTDVPSLMGSDISMFEVMIGGIFPRSYAAPVARSLAPLVGRTLNVRQAHSTRELVQSLEEEFLVADGEVFILSNNHSLKVSPEGYDLDSLIIDLMARGIEFMIYTERLETLEPSQASLRYHRWHLREHGILEFQVDPLDRPILLVEDLYRNRLDPYGDIGELMPPRATWRIQDLPPLRLIGDTPDATSRTRGR